MDASFVQVPPAFLSPANAAGEKPKDEGEKYRIGNRALASLERVLSTTLDDDNSAGVLPHPLCIPCIQQYV